MLTERPFQGHLRVQVAEENNETEIRRRRKQIIFIKGKVELSKSKNKQYRCPC
jgi:hypothetical protein